LQGGGRRFDPGTLHVPDAATRLHVHLAALAVLVLLALPSAAHGAAAPRVTVITDSVGGVLLWDPEANRILTQGFDVDVQPTICRKLVEPGCGAYDPPPPSALATIEQLGPKLGKIVVIDTGYNDTTPELAQAIDPVMRALVGFGVEHVIWVDYVEHLTLWANHNAALVRAAPRWPQMQIADWNAVALPHDDWFVDEAHMGSEGGHALARFLHVFMQYDCGAACVVAPEYCGLARTVNGFDYVRATGVGCAAALGSVPSFERGVRDGWACSRNVGSDVELTCVNGVQKIEVLERSPVPATRSGGTVTLSNWSFRLSAGVLLGREGAKPWRSFGRGPWCVPDVPREVLVALRLRALTPSGGCFA
jgi:hypothetical protein